MILYFEVDLNEFIGTVTISTSTASCRNWYETSAELQQKICNSMVAGACQSFQFFRQNTLLLENNRTLPV